mmetsp:Transcript_12413/g.34172  ORF Transcript_12413/g.34172 Transcript_12413/m.34172 type:complete len:197 (+) Transcript_12413:249-839(+)
MPDCPRVGLRGGAGAASCCDTELCGSGTAGMTMDCKKKLVVGLWTEKDCALPGGRSVELNGVAPPASPVANRWLAGKDCAEGRGNRKDVGDGNTAGPYPEPQWPRVGDAEFATTCRDAPKRWPTGGGCLRSAGALTAVPLGHRLCNGDTEWRSVVASKRGSAAAKSGGARFLVGDCACCGQLLLALTTGDRGKSPP